MVQGSLPTTRHPAAPCAAAAAPLPPPARPTVTLVCRKWRDVFWAEPSLWRSIRLAQPCRSSAEEEAAGAAQQLQVLRRAARHVQAAEISAVHRSPQPAEAATWHAAELLLLLQPGTLRALALRHVATRSDAPACLPEAALDALPRLATGLTRLELAGSRLAGRPAAAALAQLRHLRQLSLHMGAVAGELLQAAAQLPALSRLELGSPPAELPARMPELLGALMQLRQLACLGCGVLPAGTVAALAELPLLEEIDLAMSLPREELPQLARLPALRRLELCERRWGTGSLALPPPAAFPALQRYRFWREAEDGRFAVRCTVWRCKASTDSHVPPAVHLLHGTLHGPAGETRWHNHADGKCIRCPAAGGGRPAGQLCLCRRHAAGWGAAAAAGLAAGAGRGAAARRRARCARPGRPRPAGGCAGR